MQQDKKRGRFELSQDRRVLEARISTRFREHESDYDYTLLYDELSNMLGQSVQAPNLSSKLTAAIKTVERDLGIKLGRDPVRGGVVRLRPSQFGPYLDDRTKKIRRAAKRTATEAARLSATPELTDEQRVSIQARGALAGAIAAFGGRKSVQRIETAVKSNEGEPLPVARTLDVFREAR